MEISKDYISYFQKTKPNFWIKSINKGFTLIELILVISIISILMVVVSPNLSSFAAKSKEQVCNINCSELEKMYNLYVITQNIKHSDKIFDVYLSEYGENICPSGGIISFQYEKINCSKHSKEDGNNDSIGDDIPYL